jgi:hypothetical protein
MVPAGGRQSPPSPNGIPLLLILFYVSTQCFMHVDMYTEFILFHAHCAWLKTSSKPRVKECSSHFRDCRCLD